MKELCERYGMDYDECRNWYDGYTQNGYEIYNPESVVMFTYLLHLGYLAYNIEEETCRIERFEK